MCGIRQSLLLANEFSFNKPAAQKANICAPLISTLRVCILIVFLWLATMPVWVESSLTQTGCCFMSPGINNLAAATLLKPFSL